MKRPRAVTIPSQRSQGGLAGASVKKTKKKTDDDFQDLHSIRMLGGLIISAALGNQADVNVPPFIMNLMVFKTFQCIGNMLPTVS